MYHPTVGDVMTTNVVGVDEGSSFKHAVLELRSHNVSGMPVVDGGGHVIGVVSEADFLAKEATRSDRPLHDVWNPLVRSRFRRRARAQTVRDVMTTPATTIGADESVSAAAALLARSGLKRLPVVDSAHRLVGIVSRKDILGTFARSDDQLADDIRHTVLESGLWLLPEDVAVTVRDGVVTLRGRVACPELVALLTALTGVVPGVVGIVNDVTAVSDDSGADS